MPYTTEQIKAIYTLPFTELLFKAQLTHREHQKPNEVQFCTLANIKSGNCPEDCNYCPQSARYNTGIEKWQLPSVEEIRQQALDAKANGSTRLCMGAAWREIKDGKDFDHILEMIKTVANTGLEPCVTLGMLNQSQAQRLKEAGLKAYNHNIDTSPEYYPQIITTRTFEDRLKTIEQVSQAGIDVCTGGIVGLGETQEDRFNFLKVLANLNPQPESVPINLLVPVEGTPLESQPILDSFELIRTIATARILMPQATVRLSAGRTLMSDETQALCFMAGANSIFTGDKLLTTANPGQDHDHQLMQKLGLQIKSSNSTHPQHKTLTLA